MPRKMEDCTTVLELCTSAAFELAEGLDAGQLYAFAARLESNTDRIVQTV